MSSSSLVLQSSLSLHPNLNLKSKNLAFNPSVDVSISNKKFGPTRVACNRSLRSFGTSLRVLDKSHTIHRNWTVYSHVEEPGNHVPPEPPSEGPGGNWDVVISLILNLFSGKTGSLSLIKNEFDTKLQWVEDIVELIEKVARGIEKIAEGLLDKIPEGKLKRALSFLEHLAERAADDADKLDTFIDKVQGEEEKVEDYTESDEEKKYEENKAEDLAEEKKHEDNEAKDLADEES